MKVAVFGATGLVGTVMLEVLEQRGFNVSELIAIASERSKGKKVSFGGKEYSVVTPEEGLEMKPQIALFSAGSDISIEWAEKFAQQGCYVIDNSSAWRMDDSKKLIVPEINGDTLTPTDKIIANPNCSTIQMLVALAPLHEAYKIRRIVVSTYQAVSGTGKAALDQLEREKRGDMSGEKVYAHQIEGNCIPQCDIFTENGYTKEEMKLVGESQKILSDPTILISPTAVRVPVVNGHSESINVEFEQPFTLSSVRWLLEHSAGVEVVDAPEVSQYPMAIDASGSDAVYVGRLRADISNPRAINMWVVSDNLRKGAATNAVQIAEIVSKFIVD